MANRTVKDANSVRGTNPQYLVEKIIRARIYECRYWKEHCFALSAELLVDKAMELKYIGGTFGGNIKPTPFICLVLKMLQIQPEKDIVVEFIRNADFKYVRALGAVYMRLVGTSMECYKYLEPLYNDFRKIREQKKDGTFCVTHMDEYIDILLREERVCDIILPRIQKRCVLEETNELEPRVSALEEDLDEMELSEDEEEIPEPRRSPERDRKRGNYADLDKPRRSPSPRYIRPPSPHKRRSRSPRERERGKERGGGGGRVPDRQQGERDRRRSRSRERRHREIRETRDTRDTREARDTRDTRDIRDRHGRHEDEEDRRRHKKHRHDDRDQRDVRDVRDRYDDRNDKHVNRRRERDDDREIREANELRARLGIQPLRP